MGYAVHGDLALLHSLQQSGLSPGGGTVELIRQKQIAENRALLVIVVAGVLVVDGEARHVRGHHVRGELHPLVVQLQGPGKGQSQRGLADAGLVLQKEVASGQHGQKRLENHIVLADNGAADFRQDLFRVIQSSPSFLTV